MASKRFIVRGMIYEMGAFLQPTKSCKSTSSDWSTLLHTNLNISNSTIENVTAEDVMSRLGVKSLIPENRVAGSSDGREKLQEKQALEELLGAKDSIRAKYVQKLREKKMAADFRRQNERFLLKPEPDIPPSMNSTGTSLPLVPGSAALVRYVQERGMMQALIADGDGGTVARLLEQFHGCRFQEVRHSEALMSDMVWRNICSDWGLPEHQVMVVVPGSMEILDMVSDSKYYICRVGVNDVVGRAGEEAKEAKEAKEQGSSSGLFSWIRRKLGGGETQDEKEKSCHANGGEKKKAIHFEVSDMMELKSVIEDLNGVSYRPTTLLVSGVS